MYLIKMGGSVISDKKEYRTYRAHVVSEIARVLPQKDLLIVHGAGSFGHILADQFNITSGFEEWKRLGFSKIERDMQDLNLKVLSSLLEKDIPAVSMPPHAFMILGSKPDIKYFDYLLQYDFVPVTYGDAIFDMNLGINICSGDLLMLELARHFHPEKTVFLTDVDGIYDRPPDEEDTKLINILHRDITPHTETKVRDVTGGMEYKIEMMRKIAAYSKVYIINGFHPERLKAVLNNDEFIGTVIL